MQQARQIGRDHDVRRKVRRPGARGLDRRLLARAVRRDAYAPFGRARLGGDRQRVGHRLGQAAHRGLRRAGGPGVSEGAARSARGAGGTGRGAHARGARGSRSMSILQEVETLKREVQRRQQQQRQRVGRRGCFARLATCTGSRSSPRRSTTPAATTSNAWWMRFVRTLGRGSSCWPASTTGAIQFVAGVTRDLTSRVHAGNLVKAVASQAGGGGGGKRPDFATGGGTQPDKLQAALQHAYTVRRASRLARRAERSATPAAWRLRWQARPWNVRRAAAAGCPSRRHVGRSRHLGPDSVAGVSTASGCWYPGAGCPVPRGVPDTCFFAAPGSLHAPRNSSSSTPTTTSAPSVRSSRRAAPKRSSWSSLDARRCCARRSSSASWRASPTRCRRKPSWSPATRRADGWPTRKASARGAACARSST